jgi:hypothetical protein
VTQVNITFSSFNNVRPHPIHRNIELWSSNQAYTQLYRDSATADPEVRASCRVSWLDAKKLLSHPAKNMFLVLGESIPPHLFLPRRRHWFLASLNQNKLHSSGLFRTVTAIIIVIALTV